MQPHRLRPLLLAGLLVTASSSHVFAVEAEAVGERLKTLLANQGIDLTYQEARIDGDDITLAAAALKGPGDDASFELGDLLLEDVTEAADGTYRVARFALDALEHQEDDLRISMTETTIEGLVLPGDNESDPLAGFMRYDHASVARVEVEDENGSLASIENLTADITVAKDNSAVDFTGAAQSFSLNLQSLVESGSSAGALEELGYQQISGSGAMEGRWQLSDGRFTLSRYEAKIDDAGTVDFLLDLGGYTPQLLQAMSDIARQMEQNQGDQQQAAQGMAMLGLLQQLTLHGTAIRFTDDSLTGKLLDYQADKMGSSPDALIAQVKTMIPAQLAPYLGADTANSIAESVATFLENPGNIEISANPETPLPFAMLAAAAMASPEMLVKQIGLAVKANQ